jgi:VIT1/CCC1 family predicted Fe2+/Mn2+ transporter
MTEKTPVARPLIITLTCALLFLVGAFLIIYTFFYTGENPEYVFYPAVHTLIIVIIFAGLSGVWNMEKWGVWTFLAAVSGKVILDLLVHRFEWWEFLILIPIGIFLVSMPKMRRDSKT